MKEETAVLQVKGLTKHFPVAGHKVVHAVDDVSFLFPAERLWVL